MPRQSQAAPRHKLTPAERRRGATAGGKARAEKAAAKKIEERLLVAELRRDRLDDALDLLARAAERAAAVLSELLAAESEQVRLRSAVALLQVLDAAETRELAQRIEALERTLNGRVRR